jgi:hypothetical protein
MFCEIALKRSEIGTFAQKLDLDEPLPVKRLISVAADEDPCSTAFRTKYSKLFEEETHWSPSRHGFSGAVFFYNEKTEHGCLLLSLAYG